MLDAERGMRREEWLARHPQESGHGAERDHFETGPDEEGVSRYLSDRERPGTRVPEAETRTPALRERWGIRFGT